MGNLLKSGLLGIPKDIPWSDWKSNQSIFDIQVLDIDKVETTLRQQMINKKVAIIANVGTYWPFAVQ